MGNTALIATLAASLVAGVALLNADYSVLASADSQARDEEAVLSERSATSAFDMAASQLQRDFGWRTGYLPTSYLGGGFEASVTGPVTGPVRINASGASQDTVSTDIVGWMTRLAAAAGALTLDADTAQVTLSGSNVLISGTDHRAASWANDNVSEGSGLEQAAIGLLVKGGGASYAVDQALGRDRTRVRGTNGDGDVAIGGLPSDFATLLGEVTNSTTSLLTGDQTLSQTFGSAAAPVILHIDGDATFVGGGGYGMLYVEGSFKASSDFTWEGLVIADGENRMAFELTGDATIRGAAYVTHTSTVQHYVNIGNTQTPAYTLWSPDDERGVLRAYTFGKDGAGDRVEGQLVGWTGSRPQNGDFADSEALSFGPDGTLYVVDNPYRDNNRGGQISRLYKITPDQLDGDPATPVNLTHIGRTNLDRTNDDELHGLAFYQGKLYGVGAGNRTVYDVSLSTGNANKVNKFKVKDAPRCKQNGNNAIDARSLTADASGNVYVSRACDNNKTQLFKFDSFPDGDARYVMTVEAKISGIGLHPDGFAYGYDSDLGRIHRIDLESQETTLLGTSVRGDIEDMALYFAGEMAALGIDEAPRVDEIEYTDAVGTHHDEVSWPGLGKVQIETVLSAPNSPRGQRRPSRFQGTTLQDFMRSRSGVHPQLNGSRVGDGEEIPLEYTGPAELPTIFFESGDDSRPLLRGKESMTFTFEHPYVMPQLVVYVADLDFWDMTIEAFDMNGTPIQTAGWEKIGSIELIPPDDGKRSTLYRNGGVATLRPDDPSRNGETILDQIVITNAAGIKTLRLGINGQADGYGIALYSRPVYEETGLLSVTMRDNASIRYSSEAIGRLAYNIPSVAARATFEMFERFTSSKVDRMFGIERRTDNTLTSRGRQGTITMTGGAP